MADLHPACVSHGGLRGAGAPPRPVPWSLITASLSSPPKPLHNIQNGSTRSLFQIGSSAMRQSAQPRVLTLRPTFARRSQYDRPAAGKPLAQTGLLSRCVVPLFQHPADRQAGSRPSAITSSFRRASPPAQSSFPQSEDNTNGSQDTQPSLDRSIAARVSVSEKVMRGGGSDVIGKPDQCMLRELAVLMQMDITNGDQSSAIQFDPGVFQSFSLASVFILSSLFDPGGSRPFGYRQHSFPLQTSSFWFKD